MARTLRKTKIAARKTPARKTPARKTAARKTAARSAARAGKPARRGRAKARGRVAKAKPQRFTASHHETSAFEGGLRRYAKYRDLGIAAATGGLARAHVIKMVPPCDPAEVSKRHYHDVEFQMVYVLKGWIKGEYEGEVVTMREGSAWLQPPKIEHAVLDYSDDCELLEIILPADFETVELE